MYDNIPDTAIVYLEADLILTELKLSGMGNT